MSIPTPTPWTSRARRFHANLAALSAITTPETITAIRQAAANSLEYFALHLTPDGNFHIRDTRKPLADSWLPDLRNHKASANLFHFDPVKTPLPAPIAFDGLSHGWLFLHIAAATQNSFLTYSCPLYILESDPLALAFLFHAHDLTQIFSHPRLRFFFDPSPEKLLANFQTALRENPTWTLPQQFVRCHFQPRLHLPMEQAIATILAEREARLVQFKQQIDAYYADKTLDFWRDRFNNPTTPLRILGITSRYTTVLRHSMAELQAAINSTNSATMRIAMEPHDHSLENPYLQSIADFQPDLIIQISRMRYENPNLPQNIPFLCWDQDNLPTTRTPQATASLTPLTFIAGHAAVFGYSHLNWPRQNLIFCHPAGASHRYHNTPLPEEVLAPYACDFSYTSNASESPETLAAGLRRRIPPALLPVFDALLRQIHDYSAQGRTFDFISILKHTRDAALAQGLSLPEPAAHDLAMDLHRFADRSFRHATLQWVSRYCLANGKTLRLYGRGWESHPEFSRWAAGIAEPGESTRAIYQASRINLQIIESGFIHSRPLDGLAAGGFFLARSPLVFGVAPDEVDTLYALARWARQNHITSLADIESAPSEEVQTWLRKTRQFFDRHGLRWALERSLDIWAELPPPSIAIPHLSEITFTSETEFAALATTFLTDEARRRKIASAMRSEVLRSFSYPVRWNQFLTHIQEVLRNSSELVEAT